MVRTNCIDALLYACMYFIIAYNVLQDMVYITMTTGSFAMRDNGRMDISMVYA